MNGTTRLRQLRRSISNFRKYSQTFPQETTEHKGIKLKNVFELDPQVETALANGSFHARRHPGINRKKTDELPQKFVNAMEILTEKRKKSQLVKLADEMRGRLWGRLMPPEKEDYIEKIQQEKLKVQAVLQEMDSSLDDENVSKIQEKVVTGHLKTKIHPWHPLGVTEEICLQYFISRTAAEYCTLHKIFSNLQQTNPDFVPRTFFDFGSGIGSGHWAANEVWKDSLKEVYNVDANINMNELASKILQITKSKSSSEEGVYFRQFLPVSTDRKYDVTLSAFTLLELPSFKDRMEAVSALWSKTENYLVIVEDGTNAGYQAVIEARNLITHIEGTDKSKEAGVHVVAPCMHELVCPRFTHDQSPCNFEVSYLPPRFLEGKQIRMKHMYSYVVLRKGLRPSEDSQWPRCVRPTLLRPKHIHLKLCTAEGKLEDVLLQKAYHCRNAFKCAKYTDWGDSLPGKIKQYELSSLRDIQKDNINKE